MGVGGYGKDNAEIAEDAEVAEKKKTGGFTSEDTESWAASHDG